MENKYYFINKLSKAQTKQNVKRYVYNHLTFALTVNAKINTRHTPADKYFILPACYKMIEGQCVCSSGVALQQWLPFYHVLIMWVKIVYLPKITRGVSRADLLGLRTLFYKNHTLWFLKILGLERLSNNSNLYAHIWVVPVKMIGIRDLLRAGDTYLQTKFNF